VIEETAEGIEAALVLEPSAAGALKTERKGVAVYRVAVTGRAAHAGLEPEQGANAAVELAHQLLAVAGLARPELGTSVTPSLVSAGTAVNVVPADAVAHVDVRSRTLAEAERIDAALRALRPVTPGTSLEVERTVAVPPLEHRASAGLFRRAQRVAAAVGLPPLREAAVGGGSDGNLLAGLGIAVLDGLGAVGGGAHAEGEYVEVDALAERAGLVAALVADLLGDSSPAPTCARDVWSAIRSTVEPEAGGLRP
jgi:glutamate carboxypeptidase